jgi:shikimate kinase
MACIFLIGFMASGKSSIGNALSALTGAFFTDMDTEAERRENMPIHQIFSQRGEPYFRELETAILHELGKGCTQERHIIATGGGLPCTGNNMDYMNERGVTVYLKSSIKDILSRVERSRDRPLFHRIGNREELEKLLLKREPYYSRAHIVIENRNSVPPEQRAEQIARILAL